MTGELIGPLPSMAHIHGSFVTAVGWGLAVGRCGPAALCRLCEFDTVDNAVRTEIVVFVDEPAAFWAFVLLGGELCSTAGAIGGIEGYLAVALRTVYHLHLCFERCVAPRTDIEHIRQILVAHWAVEVFDSTNIAPQFLH